MSTIYPIHGNALATPSFGIVIAAIDEITGTSASRTDSFHSRAPLRPGETFDAYLDTRTETLEDVNAASAFVPGLPNRLITHIAALGDPMPAYLFESQSGRLLQFSNFRGKVVLLSFTYSRCPDRSRSAPVSTRDDNSGPAA